MGVIELNIGEYSQPYEIEYWLPMLEFDFFLILFLLPFRFFRESTIQKVVLPNRRILDLFSTIIIILSFYAIFFFASSVSNVFMMANLSDARNSMVAGEDLYFEAGIKATIASVSAANYVFAIVLFFIYEIIGGSKIRKVLLLIASLSEPLHILSFVGRDGIVFWIFTFVFCYAFFKPYMQVSNTKRLVRVFIVLGLVMLVPFLLISISRFGESETGTSGSFVSYLGHAFIQGPLFFGIDNKPIIPGANFPLFRSLLGLPPAVSGGGANIIGEWVPYKFSTFIVSLYQGLDIFGLIVLIVFIYMIFAITFGKAKKTTTFSQFIVYLLYFQIVSQGVFYFKHYTRGGNLFIISCFALSILFSVLQQAGAPIVINKIEK